MNDARATTSAAPGRILLQAAGSRQTGALVVDAVPGGTVYLDDGLVTYAESPAAPGIGELLTASGRLSPRTWEAAVEAGTDESRVGQLLVEQGHLTRGELELCLLGVIYDAAYFVLRPTSAPIEFITGAAPRLGPVIRVDAAAVARESRRRGRLLDEIFPNPEVDVAPVTPVARPPAERIYLTGMQWELLVHADGQRTPTDLAQLLGRAGYATIMELRRLAARGLLDLPHEGGEAPALVRLPHSGGPAVDIRRPLVPAAGGPIGAPHVADAAAATGDPPTGDPPTGDHPKGAAERPRLPRRKPNAKLPRGMPADVVHAGTDDVLLKRIRTALRALR